MGPIGLTVSCVGMGLVSCSGARHTIEFPHKTLEHNLAAPLRPRLHSTPWTSQSSEKQTRKSGICLTATRSCFQQEALLNHRADRRVCIYSLVTRHGPSKKNKKQKRKKPWALIRMSRMPVQLAQIAWTRAGRMKTRR